MGRSEPGSTRSQKESKAEAPQPGDHAASTCSTDGRQRGSPNGFRDPVKERQKTGRKAAAPAELWQLANKYTKARPRRARPTRRVRRVEQTSDETTEDKWVKQGRTSGP